MIRKARTHLVLFYCILPCKQLKYDIKAENALHATRSRTQCTSGTRKPIIWCEHCLNYFSASVVKCPGGSSLLLSLALHLTLEMGIAGRLRQQDLGAVSHIAYASGSRGREREGGKGRREGGLLLFSSPPNLSIGNAPPTVGRSSHFSDPNQDGPLQAAQR